MRGAYLLFLCLVASPSLCLAEPLDVARELKTYYENHEKALPFETAIRNLASPDVKLREQASEWLVAILSQSLKDEQSGTAPWRATPYWGSSGENPARKLREGIAGALAQSEETAPAAVPALSWFLESEILPAVQIDALKALNKLATPEAGKVRQKLVLQPHHNYVVVAQVLKRMATSKETLAPDALLALCQHYRASVREAARALHKQTGASELPPFDAVTAMRSAPVAKLLKEINALLIDQPPAAAPWIAAKYTYFDNNKKEKAKREELGWLLSEKEKEAVIFTPWGRRETIRKSAEFTRSNERESWQTCSLERSDIASEVARVERVRTEGAKNFEFSEQGALTGQFKGRGASCYELILAERLHAAGELELSARVLFPALETLYRDDASINIVKQSLGKEYGYQMLVAFVGDRDYARAEQLAVALARHYPDTIFHHYSVRLAEELPLRRDDFVKLKLPTPEEWRGLKAKLSRAEQIDFLSERYRLLNYFQMGQPGGYMPGATQFAEPSGMERNASWGLQRGKTAVINPETELAGVVSWRDKNGPRGLELTLKDVPVLSKHLRNDWLMPTVTFWRDFAAERSLSGTRSEFASIINGLAARDVCKIDTWKKLSAAEIEKEIERINTWASANVNKTLPELKWEALTDALASGAGIGEVHHRVEYFLEQKDGRVYDVLAQLLKRKENGSYEKTQILEMYLKHDLARAKDLAPKLLTDADQHVRFKAALIVFQTDGKDAARLVLGEGLENQDLDQESKTAVELLLKDGSPASREQVLRLMKNQTLVRSSSRGEVRASLLKMCVDAGLKEPYSYYFTQLDNQEVAYSSFSTGDQKPTQTTYAQIHAREIVRQIAPEDPAVKSIVKQYPKDVDQIPHLKKWLEAKLAAK